MNRAVADELTAVHQYMYFRFHCDDQGYDLLAYLFRKTAVEEMLHVEHLAERLLFLVGEVEMVVGSSAKKTHDVKTMLEAAKKMEVSSVADYNRFANDCSANADSASTRVFEDLVLDEGRHMDQYDNELDAMNKSGDRYLALQSIERSKSRATGQPPE